MPANYRPRPVVSTANKDKIKRALGVVPGRERRTSQDGLRREPNGWSAYWTVAGEPVRSPVVATEDEARAYLETFKEMARAARAKIAASLRPDMV